MGGEIVLKPKVSIIVPVYKAEKYLNRCLDSLRKQTLKEIEIILVDDSSPDRCPSLCDQAAKEDMRIKVIHKKNEGAGFARNAGMKVADGKYIGFVDSDDYVDLTMYETLYNEAEKYNSDLVMSGVIFVDGNMFRKEGERIYKTYFDEDTHFTTEEDLKKLKRGIVGALPYESYDSRYGMSVWKNLFKREIIEQNSLQFCSEREMLSEDSLFMIDYLCCIKKATGIKPAFYNYCRNEGSFSKTYNKDGFEKCIVFLGEVEERFKRDMSPNEYQLYLDRFFQAFCRVLCSQAIMYAKDNKIKYRELRKRLKEICTHSKTRTVIESYPITQLPLKQAVFAFTIKHKLYLLQKLIVGLRNR